jgi:glyceraldehyde 3-phosphate dehydrogenase
MHIRILMYLFVRMLKIAINGFGRIGRMFLRSILEKDRKDIEIVAINDTADTSSLLHLFRYDSVHGRFIKSVEYQNNSLCFDDREIKVFQIQGSNFPWQQLDVDVVVECSGNFKSRKLLQKHLDAGSKKVLVSTIVDDMDYTVIYGVNHTGLGQEHKLISNASCTSNCLIPMLYVLDKYFEIVKANATSVHAFTGDQSITDKYHKDLRRSRAVSCSMIPSTTNASKAVDLVFPHLSHKVYCSAVRVPIVNVSMIDLHCLLLRDTNSEELNDRFIEESRSSLRNVLEVSKEELVSVDFISNKSSAIVDSHLTQVTDRNLCRVVAWYDNEFGYANRMLDVIQYIKEQNLC